MDFINRLSFYPFFFSKKTHASCTYNNYIFQLTWNWQQVSTKVGQRPSVICLPPSKAKHMSLMEDDFALWTFFICYTFCTTILIRLKKPNALGGYKIENYHIFIPTWMSGNGRVEHVSLFHMRVDTRGLVLDGLRHGKQGKGQAST